MIWCKDALTLIYQANYVSNKAVQNPQGWKVKEVYPISLLHKSSALKSLT